MSTIEATKSPADGVVTKAQWAARAVHQITLPTGARVKVKLPDLSRLIRNNLLPENLRAAALRQAFDDVDVAAPVDGPVDKQKEDDERFKTAKELVELLDGLLLDMLVEPKLGPGDVDEIPGEDRDMLVAIAQRERATDALGVRLGVAPLSAFEVFRELHGCVDREPEGCEACKALQQQFSTADLGGV